MAAPRKATGAPPDFQSGDSGFDPRPRHDECPVGGPHYFEKIDPRDERQLGMSGLHCVECGAAPPEGTTR